MLSIKVLGPEGAKVRRIEILVRSITEMLGIDAEVALISDFDVIMEYGIMALPALVINDQLVCWGRVPTESEITVWMTDAMEAV